jgi:hypothetical protein
MTSLTLARFKSKVVLTINNDYTSPSLVFEPHAPSTKGYSYSLQQISLAGPDEVFEKPIYAVMGVIQLLAGPYLIAVTQSELVGSIQGHEIWCIKEGSFVKYFLNISAELVRVSPKSALESLNSQQVTTFHYYDSFSRLLMRGSTSQ